MSLLCMDVLFHILLYNCTSLAWCLLINLCTHQQTYCVTSWVPHVVHLRAAATCVCLGEKKLCYILN